jgi:hypothetical protein
MDDGSSASESQMLSTAQQAAVPVYSIGLGDLSAKPLVAVGSVAVGLGNKLLERMEGHTLQTLSQQTNGAFFPVNTQGPLNQSQYVTLKQALNTISQELRR